MDKIRGKTIKEHLEDSRNTIEFKFKMTDEDDFD